MAGTTIDLEMLIEPDSMAVEIANVADWNNLRRQKVEEWKELRNYLYATDTRTTRTSKLAALV
jgi:hypothetical protein